MGRISNAWKALFGQQGTTSAGNLLPGVLLSGSAPRRGTVELLRAYKRLPYLHAVLRRIAEDTAAVPWTVYAPTKKGSRTKALQLAGARGPAREALVAKAVQKGELREVEGHPFLGVLASMNPALGGHDSWVVLQLWLDLIGQAPLVRQNNQLGLPMELWPVPPHWIAETPSASSPYYRASYGAWQRLFTEEEVVWLRAVDPEHPYARGTSYGEALADALDTSELLEKYRKNFLYRDARPGAILDLDGGSPEEADRLGEAMNAQHGGAKKGGLFVTSRKVNYTPLEQTWQEMGMGDLRQEDRALIQEVLQIPPELMGNLENSNRATIDAARLLYTTGAIVPRKERQRVALQRVLDEYHKDAQGRPQPGMLILGYVNPVPEDETAQRAHLVAVPYTAKVNEHRAAQGLMPLEGEEGEAMAAPPQPASPLGGLGFSAGREDPTWTRALPRGVVRSTQAALEALRPEALTAEVGAVEEEGFRQWAEAAMREVGVAPRFDMRNPLVRQRLEAYAGERIRLMNDTTRDALRETLAEGAAAGEGVRELANRVADVFDDAEDWRARRIARTEVVGLSNAANVEAWRQSGVVDGKEWLAVRDGNTRDEHRALDGQVVALDAAFTAPGGAQAQHPGGFGRPDLDIQCRCTALPKVAEKSAMSEEQKAMRWKAYDEALLPWEERLEAAFRRGFRKQRAAVLAALGVA